MLSRSSSRCLASPVTLKPERSVSMSLREVVSHIIEDLDVRETEEEIADTVNKVEQEEIVREGKKCFQCGKEMEYSDQMKTKSVSGDLQSKIRLHCAVDTGDNLIQVISETL